MNARGGEMAARFRDGRVWPKRFAQEVGPAGAELLRPYLLIELLRLLVRDRGRLPIWLVLPTVEVLALLRTHGRT